MVPNRFQNQETEQQILISFVADVQASYFGVLFGIVWSISFVNSDIRNKCYRLSKATLDKNISCLRFWEYGPPHCLVVESGMTLVHQLMVRL
jgi:hypothetical protein